jgi:hypothetical protein
MKANLSLKGITGSVDKFAPKLATICKLLQAGGRPYWTGSELVFGKKQLIMALQQLLVSF